MADWRRKGNDKVLAIQTSDNVGILILDSLIDLNTQYFIAESTKTVDLIDNTKHAPRDEIWMGCGSVSKDFVKERSKLRQQRMFILASLSCNC